MIEWANENEGFSAFLGAIALIIVTLGYATITGMTLSAMRKTRDREEARWRIETVADLVANARTASALYQDSVQPAEHLVTTYLNQGINSNGFQIGRTDVTSALDRAEDYRQQVKGMQNRLIFIYGKNSPMSQLAEPISKRLDRQRDKIRSCLRWVDQQSSPNTTPPDPTPARDGLPDDLILEMEDLVRKAEVSVMSRGKAK